LSFAHSLLFTSAVYAQSNTVDSLAGVDTVDITIRGVGGHGAAQPEKIASGEKLPSLHSSQFAPVPGPTIKTGIKAMTATVLNLMK
jgi:hypothetical protein